MHACAGGRRALSPQLSAAAAAAACCRRRRQPPCLPPLQFAKRGQLEEYPDEDDYQDWQSEDGSGSSSGSASEAGAAAQVRAWRLRAARLASHVAAWCLPMSACMLHHA